MKKEYAIKVLKYLGYTEGHIDLAGKVLSLEENIASVELSSTCSGHNKLLANVRLQNDFKDKESFRAYLKKNNLPYESARTEITEEGKSYFFQREGFKANFR